MRLQKGQGLLLCSLWWNQPGGKERRGPLAHGGRGGVAVEPSDKTAAPATPGVECCVEATLSPSQKHSALLSRDLIPGKLTLDSRLRGVSLPVPRTARKWSAPHSGSGSNSPLSTLSPVIGHSRTSALRKRPRGTGHPPQGLPGSVRLRCGRLSCADSPLRPAQLSCTTRASSVPLSQRPLTTPTPSACTQGCSWSEPRPGWSGGSQCVN